MSNDAIFIWLDAMLSVLLPPRRTARFILTKASAGQQIGESEQCKQLGRVLSQDRQRRTIWESQSSFVYFATEENSYLKKTAPPADVIIINQKSVRYRTFHAKNIK